MKRIFTTGILVSFLQFFAQSQSANSALNIFVQNTTDSLADVTVVGFNALSTDSFNPKYDANKLPGAENRPTLYTLNGGQWMSINILTSIANVPTVSMGLEPGSSANFVMSFTNVSSFDPTTYLYLEDIQANVMHNIRKGDYSFFADSTENWNRFILNFTPPAVIATTDATCGDLGTINITQPGPASWSYVLEDPSNGFTMSGNLNAGNPLAVSVPASSYILTLTDTNHYTAVKTILVGGVPTVSAGFTPSSENVQVQAVVSFTNTSQNAGSYTWDFGDGTTSTEANPTHVYTAPGNYSVSLTAINGAECSTSVAQTIVVSRTTTGIADISANNLNMWSHGSNVYVDFTQAGTVNAVIKIFDILGREISNDKFSSSTLYQKELNTIDAAYVIVNVSNGDKIITRKFFISNGK